MDLFAPVRHPLGTHLTPGSPCIQPSRQKWETRYSSEPALSWEGPLAGLIPWGSSDIQKPKVKLAPKEILDFNQCQINLDLSHLRLGWAWLESEKQMFYRAFLNWGKGKWLRVKLDVWSHQMTHSPEGSGWNWPSCSYVSKNLAPFTEKETHFVQLLLFTEAPHAVCYFAL